uniref:Uncharacterized protein n=1 Tax=Anopheles melas TaxID=34690 RepID=A0A182TSV0_9DIPT
MANLRDEKNELPADFNEWLSRWALETTGVLALDTRLGVLHSTDSGEGQRLVDTSAGSVAILYCLAKNPEKQAKLRAELRTIMPTKDTRLTASMMSNLPYLRACIKEGMRMFPPTAGNFRATGRDIVLQGYRVPSHTDIAMGAQVLLRDEKYFHRPTEFIPERWLNDRDASIPSAKEVNPFIFLPFGFGSRSCIGKRLAMMEMEVILARWIRQFEFRWNYEDYKFRTTVINMPGCPLKFEIRDLED